MAPIVRRVANSRVRCAIVMDSEFAMTKEPTKSAIPREREQEAPEERDEVVRVCCVLRRLLAARPDLRGGRQDALDLAHELGVRHVGLRGDCDLVELARLPEQPLRGREVEAGERRAADREARAELDDPGDAKVRDRAFGLDADRLPDGEVLLRGRLLVDHDLVAARPGAIEQRERVEDRIPVRYREAEVRGSTRDDRLAVVADELRRVRVDAPLGLRNIRQLADLREERLVEGRCADPLLIREIDGRLAA